MQGGLAGAASRLAEGFPTAPLQWLCLAAAGPVLFVVPWWQPVYGVCLLVAQQVLRCLDPAERRRALDLDVTWPTLGLIGMALVGLSISPSYERSLPQFVGLAFNVGVFTAVVSTMRGGWTKQSSTQSGRLVLATYAGLGVLVAFAEFANGMARSSDLILVTALRDARPDLPPLLTYLLHVLVRPNMHPNLVAGTLTLFLPLFVALLLYRPWRGGEGGGGSRGWLVATGLGLVFLGLVFLATLSRGGFISLGASLFLLVIWRGRRAPRTLTALGIGLLALVGVPLVGALLGAWPNPLVVVERAYETTRLDAAAGTFATRVEGWPHVVRLVAEHPWTGLGLNQTARYLRPINPYLFHAHNLFLQVALDLGLPGLCFLLGKRSGLPGGEAKTWVG